MRKRTRKHRGTAGKMVGGFLAFFCLILLTAGMFWAIQGYVSYQKAVKEKPLAQAVEEIRSEAQWVPLKQVPELYKKSGACCRGSPVLHTSRDRLDQHGARGCT